MLFWQPLIMNSKLLLARSQAFPLPGQMHLFQTPHEPLTMLAAGTVVPDVASCLQRAPALETNRQLPHLALQMGACGQNLHCTDCKPPRNPRTAAC